MMTEIEAIKILKRDLAIQTENKALPDGINAIAMAIKAIEKQIPKKVKYDEYGKEEGYPYCECGECLINDLVGVKHCPNCGQKLDWE